MLQVPCDQVTPVILSLNLIIIMHYSGAADGLEYIACFSDIGFYFGDFKYIELWPRVSHAST